MRKAQTIIDDLKSLRGKEVRIFGQKTVLRSEIDELEIDAVDIVENLREFEIDLFVENYNEDTEEYEEVETDSIEECLESLENNYGPAKVTSNNSYNWNGNISNHFCYHVYDFGIGCVFVEFSVHRYGDVRANYTDSMLLKFDSLYMFYEVVNESTKYISVEVNGNTYDIDISPFNEGIEVYTIDGDYIKTVYSCNMNELKLDLQ